tara:strand:+ start:525 stop:779 length:255 start_codon:yes stop_codon:yes gene_type:complete
MVSVFIDKRKWSEEEFRDCVERFEEFLSELHGEQRDPELMVPIMFGILVDMMIDVHGPEDAREMMGLNVMSQCRRASGDATTIH